MTDSRKSRRPRGRTVPARTRRGKKPISRPSGDILPSPAAQPVPSDAASSAGPQPIAAEARRRPGLWYLAVGATVFILAVFVFFAFRMMTTIEEQNQQLIASSGAFRELNARMTGLRNELSRKDDLLRMLSARNITVVLLKGTGSNRNAWGKILWDPAKRGAILHVEGLSPVTPGQEYQIWLVRGERAWSAGVFVVTAPGSTMFRIDTLPAVSPRGTTTIAVTLERTGGAVRPQGPVCMTGSAQM